MKKILSTVAISAVLSTGAIAGDVYGSIGAAITSPTIGDSGVSMVATGGMKLDSVFPRLSAEVELSQTVADVWDDVSVFGIGAYAVYNFLVPNTMVTIKPRLGLNYESWDVPHGYFDYSDTGFSYGVGASYPINNGLTVYADFTDKGHTNNIGAGVGMSF